MKKYGSDFKCVILQHYIVMFGILGISSEIFQIYPCIGDMCCFPNMADRDQGWTVKAHKS